MGKSLLQKLAASTFAVIVLLTAGLASASCISVTKCETIGTSGNYCVPDGAGLSSSGDCLLVKAPNVNLDISGNPFTGSGITITGTGTGTALHAYSNASHFTFFAGGGVVISKFQTGIEDDANGAILEFGSYDGAAQITSVNIGILFNNVSYSQFLSVSYGQVAAQTVGFLISGGISNYIANTDLQSTTFSAVAGDGLRLVNTSGTLVDDLYFHGGVNGVHVLNSTGDVLNNVTGSSSTSGNGFLIEGGRGNTVYKSYANSNGYGIRIKSNSLSNAILENQASQNTYYDLFQGTPTASTAACYGNFWLSNSFTTRNQTCIQ